MTDGRSDVRCERRHGLLERVVADRLTADDRDHASTCRACGPMLLRAARFDDELRRAAEGLVVERLPYGVLDPELAPRLVTGLPTVRRAAPGLASIFAAIAVVVVAMTVGLAPGGFGGGTQPPATLQASAEIFRPTVDIIRSVEARYGQNACFPGHSAGPTAPAGEREGVICLSPKEIENANASIIPVENRDGNVVEVDIKGSLFGTDTLTSRDELASLMGDLTSEAIADPTRAADAAAFVVRALPGLRVLPSGDDAQMIFGDLRVSLLRYPGGSYILVLQPADKG